MSILNVHQSKSSDHDRLGFHPDCPICRQDRLSGVFFPEPIWSRRVRVLLTAGVLAVSAGGTATSVASEPDDQQEGVVVSTPGAPPPGDQPGGSGQPVGDGLGQGSGGETALPVEIDPVLTSPEHSPPDGQLDGAAPLEATPIDDPEGGLALSDPTAPAEGDSLDVDPGDVDASDAPVEATPPGTSEPPTIPSDDRADQPDAEDIPAAKPEQRPGAKR